jgi:AcrR family transcriptional regulator
LNVRRFDGIDQMEEVRIHAFNARGQLLAITHADKAQIQAGQWQLQQVNQIGARLPHGRARELILDAAEVLFSNAHLDAVSFRDLAREAGVSLSAIHYHFGSKDALIEAVFHRRLDPMNAERLAALERLEQEAIRNGSAIATGSGLDVTIETVAEWAKTLQEKGILLVPLSAAYKGRAT